MMQKKGSSTILQFQVSSPGIDLLPMALQRISDWKKLPVTLAELCIDTTLRCGQSFRWRKINDEWFVIFKNRYTSLMTNKSRRCSLHGRILSLRQDSSHLHYRVTWPEKPLSPSGDDTEALLRNYFNLGVNLENLYRQWSKADTNFRKKAPEFTGVRILNQDGWEALIAFICSSNNNISRISQMVCPHM
jgi:N-glycosylase/DNA lyase